MRDVIGNELRRLLISMRFQLLFAVGALLFVSAGLSSANRFEVRRQAFLDLANLENERFARVARTGAWGDHVVQLSLPPSSLDLLFEGNSQYLPDVFGFNAANPLRIRYASSLGYNFAMPRFNRLDWTFIVLYFFTFGAFVLTFDAVSGERENGTLRLVGSYSLPRYKLILGKHLAALLALLAAVAVGSLASFLVFVLLAPGAISDRHVWATAVWHLGSALTLSVYAAIGVCLSTLCRRSSQSLYLGLTAWIVLVVGIPSAAHLAASWIHPTRTASEVDREVDLRSREAVLKREREPVRTPAELAQARREIGELFNQQIRSNLNQALLAAELAKISPNALFSDSLNRAFRSGIPGIESLIAEVAFEAAAFAQRLKQNPEAAEHPITAFADRWKQTTVVAIAWKDWAALAALTLFFLVLAAAGLAKSDLH